MTPIPRPPSLGLLLTEFPRASYESLRMLGGMGRLVERHRAAGRGQPVLVLPGYGAADGSTAVLRYFLKRIGFDVFALALGRNVEKAENRIRSIDDATFFREQMAQLVVERIFEIHQQAGEAVSMVGWSMGGLYALDASKSVPELVRQVVTMGSPFGDPRGTTLFTPMRRLSGSTVPLEEQNFEAWLEKAKAGEVPTKVLYSLRDGIVGEPVARLSESPMVEHHEVRSSHIGFAVNLQAMDRVAKTLIAA
jgi:pimeloyl-ACP methyl ester carboxylesterase